MHASELLAHSTELDGAGRHLLVADDEATIRLALAEVLELEGYVVETARDGGEALHQLRQRRSDAAVVDLMMPGMDGWALLRACRADPWLLDLPVIVMSARPDASQSVAEFGVQGCLLKPFDVDELLAVLEQTWASLASCAICAASGAAQAVPVFVRQLRPATWRLCARCWSLLEAGFEHSRPAGSLDAYLQRPGFRITDAEVRGYLRLGLT